MTIAEIMGVVDRIELIRERIHCETPLEDSDYDKIAEYLKNYEIILMSRDVKI